jgi:hypothetical protein
MNLQLIISIAMMGSMLWFGVTFLYFLRVIRKDAGGKANSFSLAKDINVLGKVHKTFLAIRRKQNPKSKWPILLVISNVLCFLFYGAVIVVGISWGVMGDL